MPVTLTHWQSPAPLSRGALESAFRELGLSPSWWSNGPDYVYAAHEHPYHKVLYCASGGVQFRLEPHGAVLYLSPGDRLDIPPGTRHSAIVGPEGVTCVEAAQS